MDTIEAAPKTKEDREIIPLPLATEAVNRALDQTTQIVTANALQLQSGDITFKTVSTTGWGLNISVFVVTLDFSHKNIKTTTITVHYHKDEPEKSLNALTSEFLFKHKDKFVPLETELIAAIKEAAAAQEGNIGKLPGQGFDISVDFSIDWKIDGGVKVPTPYIVAGGDLSHEKQTTHSVKLVFQKTPAPSK